MRPPKLSVQSVWLLKHLAGIYPGLMCSSHPLHVHWSMQPGVVNMRGLIRRGWATETVNGLFKATPEGVAADANYEEPKTKQEQDEKDAAEALDLV